MRVPSLLAALLLILLAPLAVAHAQLSTNAAEEAPVAEEPEPKVPADLRKALTANAAAKATWSDITPVARRDWIHWISSGK